MDKIKIHKDDRGNLIALDFSEVPFTPVRFFTVFDVPKGKVRGGHCHRSCFQYLLCMEGIISLKVEGSWGEMEVYLYEGDAILINPMEWAEQKYLTGKDILIVLCSHEYDAADYIRDYEEFKTAIA